MRRNTIPMLFAAIFFIIIAGATLYLSAQTMPSDPVENLTLSVGSQTPDGDHTISWPDKSVMASGGVKSGAKQGLWNVYYQGTGKIWAKGTYKNDLKDGEWEYFDTKGIREERIQFRKGVIWGERLVFYRDGKVHFEFQYKDNKKNGKAGVYYETGCPIEILWYNNDKKDGFSNLYYPNGRKKEIGRYLNGVKNGIWSMYDENGMLQQRGEYKNDVKSGVWKTFDGKGKVTEETKF